MRLSILLLLSCFALQASQEETKYGGYVKVPNGEEFFLCFCFRNKGEDSGWISHVKSNKAEDLKIFSVEKSHYELDKLLPAKVETNIGTFILKNENELSIFRKKDQNIEFQCEIIRPLCQQKLY